MKTIMMNRREMRRRGARAGRCPALIDYGLSALLVLCFKAEGLAYNSTGQRPVWGYDGVVAFDVV